MGYNSIDAGPGKRFVAEGSADTLSWCSMLAGLTVANGADVLRRLTTYRIDVPGLKALVEILPQRR